MAWIILIVFAILAFSLLYLSEKRNNRVKKRNGEKLDEIIKSMIYPQDESSIVFIADDKFNAIIASEKQQKIYIVNPLEIDLNFHIKYSSRVICFEDIIEAEVVFDDETITKTARGSQIGGAVVGGLLLGGVGAIVGGLSGRTKSIEEVKNIDIKLTVNNIQEPICRINFLHDTVSESGFKSERKHGYSKDSIEYKKALEEVEKWQGIFEVILKGQVSS